MPRSCRLVLLWPLLCAARLCGQSPSLPPLTAEWEGVALTEVLTSLENVYGLQFSYLDAAVQEKTVECNFAEADWEEVANCLFRDNGLVAQVTAGGIVTLANDTRPWFCLRVIDDEGEPLPFVTLSAPATGWVAHTGADGRFEGHAYDDSLRLSYVGYADRAVGFRGKCVEVVMRAEGVDLSSVTVRDYLTPGVRANIDGRRVRIDPATTTPLPGFVGGELYRKVAQLPGVTLNGEAAGNLSIRGGARDQNLVLWDGIPVYAAGHYFGLISLFEPALVERLELQRGHSSADFGGRLSGVIELATDGEVATDLAGGAEVNLLYGSAFGKLPLAGGSADLQVAGRTSLNGLFGGPTYESYRQQVFQRSSEDTRLRGFRRPVSSEEQSGFGEFNGRYLYRLSPASSLRISGFHQENEYTYTEDGGFRDNALSDRLYFRNQGLGVGLTTDLGGGRSLLARISGSRLDSEGAFLFREFRVGSEDRQRSYIGEANARLQYAIPLAGGKLTSGVQSRAYDNDYRIERTTRVPASVREGERRGRATVIATYLDYDRLIGERAGVRIGLRLPWHAPSSKLLTEPRLSAYYRLSDSWLVKSAFGINHQFVAEVAEVNAYRVSTQASLWVLADGGRLEPVAGREFSFGFTGQRRGWLLDLEVYRKTADGLPSINQLPTAGDPLIARLDSRGYGLDALAERRWGRWTAWAQYSLSRLDWRLDREGTAYFAANEDRRHQLQFMLSRNFGRFAASVAWQYRSGARYTEVQLNRRGDGTQRLTAQNINAELLPAYHRLDLTIRYRCFPPSRTDGFRASVELSLLNVYDRENFLDRSYRTRDGDTDGDNRIRLQEIDRIGLGFTPNVGLRAEF